MLKKTKNYKFGKLTKGLLTYAPYPLIIINEDGTSTSKYCDDEVVHLSLGYKKIIKDNYPTDVDDEKQYVVEIYSETDTIIHISYEVHDKEKEV